MRANADRMQIEENKAFQVGDDLVNLLSNMTAITKTKLERRTQDSLAGIDRMKIYLFVLISLGPFCGVVLAIILIEGFTKPLSALLHATRKLKGGDLSYRIESLRHEFGEVATSFNEMAGSLNEQMHKMHRAEQMTMVGEMAAGLVHEIKNPLAGIKASMQVLLEEGGIPEEDHTILTKVMSEVERIEALMKSLLNFAKPPKPLKLQVNMNDVL
jgi:nitrogen fixation/metabolism regulation signal transduction histidine kinase